MELTEQNKIPMLVMFSASMKITSMGYKYVFRTCPQSAMQTEATAKYAMEDLKLKKAAFIGRNDAWAKSSLEQFTKRVKARGGEVVAAEFFDLGSTDFYSQLTKIKMANPEFLYMVSLTEDGSMLIRQARELGLKCVLTGTDELANEKAFQLAGKAMDNVYCYLISGPTQPYQKKYEELYASKYPEKSTTLDKGGWDQVMLIADALKRAGSLDPTAIRDALAKTKNFQGMKLDVTFSDIGQVQAKMYMAYLKDNKWHFIKDMKIFDNPPLPVDRE
jgi:branched-chain amino acid transport system substrate-binding protein